jgi:histone acetyltransferase (RNA polymerase elongator complex component)
MQEIDDIEDVNLRITPIEIPNIEKVLPSNMVEKIDKILYELNQDKTLNIPTLLRRYKISVKHITLLHRYRQLVYNGKMNKDDELDFILLQKKGRVHSGVEVIAVSTYPEGKFAGCPADCHYCPKEPEKYFNVYITGAKETENRTILMVKEQHEIDKYFAQVINKIIIDAIEYTVLYSQNHSGIIQLFFPLNCFSITPKKGDVILAYKTAQPRSYVSSEPAVARANQTGWNCVAQFREIAGKRIMCGHNVTKVEAIVIGGTWSYYPTEYQRRFIRDIYFSANTLYDDISSSQLREPLTLDEEKGLNQTAKCRIIGLTLETRPDFVNYTEIRKLLTYGCTRVQIGVQHIEDKVLKAINRGCYTSDTIRAIRLLKNAGFKVDIHLMPDLPSSSFETDRKMFERVLMDHRFQADQWKIYPCQTMEYTVIKEWYEKGLYKPYFEQTTTVYSDNIYLDKMIKNTMKYQEMLWTFLCLSVVYSLLINPTIVSVILSSIFWYMGLWFDHVIKRAYKTNPLFQLLIHFIPRVPEWIRLNRIIRDNPSHTIVGGLNQPHYRNILEERMNQTGCTSRDIRHREIKNRKYDEKHVEYRIRKYYGSGSLELFISFEDVKNDYLLGFARLRCPKKNEMSSYIPELKNASLLRELHVYGWMVPQESSVSVVQHRGLGQKLVRMCETISKYYGYENMAIISGVGVREYYKNKLGYKLDGSYMVKRLGVNNSSPMKLVWKQSWLCYLTYLKTNFISKFMY